MAMVETKFKNTDIGLIPENWEVINLKDNCILKARIGWQGLTTSEYKESGNHFLITGTDFKNGFIDWNNCVFVDKSRYDQDKNIQIQSEDVLITKDGTIGKVAYIDKIPKPTTLNSGVFVLRKINNKLNSKFVYYVLMSFYFDNFLKQITAGSTITHLYQKDFIHFNFILPSLPEQKAIAEVLSGTDTWIESLEKLIVKKQLIKQGAMQKLLTPKEDWETKKLGEIINVFRGGSPRPIQNFITNTSNGINWIKIGDTSPKGKYINNTEEKIIPAGEKYSRLVNSGDFLLSNSMSFGRPYILKIDGCIHDGWLVLQNYHSHFETEFLYYLLTSKLIIDQYKSKAAGSGVLNLNKELVKSVYLQYPKIKEQTRIATILSDMDTEIENLEQKLTKAQQIKQGLMQELLTGRIRLV
ncbi:restriction endonuclease subunit S [Elizabethkingia anophelis]|jgi:type I restriction enzyme S subunit|uniref:restriction endonuclease subunit S n=2 Tax=Flavobacterium lindanitolerans TaxID=428988 RepID=UPI0021A4EA49|nr:restriction endonuclease subunit S [Flavobacterium lindanitolerans]MCT4142048.1 restriction endonuclease subunit S [Elizabethkingia anophelis]MCT4281068.1 restriction endonuclease subunit S [Elizabethkingia anophelis]